MILKFRGGLDCCLQFKGGYMSFEEFLGGGRVLRPSAANLRNPSSGCF